jgi:hypothetical protein
MPCSWLTLIYFYWGISEDIQVFPYMKNKVNESKNKTTAASNAQLFVCPVSFFIFAFSA